MLTELEPFIMTDSEIYLKKKITDKLSTRTGLLWKITMSVSKHLTRIRKDTNGQV